MSIVGIDPSLTACGIAVLDLELWGETTIERLRSVGTAGRKGDGWTRRSDRIVAQTRRVVANIPAGAQLVVIESMPQSMARPLPSFGDRWALWFGIYSTLRARGVPIAVVMPSTRAQWATGKGDAEKSEVVAAVREQWPASRVADDNEADALTLAAMGAHHLGWPLPFETKERHMAGLDKIEWPEVSA